MIMDFSNYAQLPADKVLDACIKYIDNRNARIEREREAVIAEYMKPRLFGLLKRSREQAIAHAKDDGIISSWFEISMAGKYAADAVYDLGILAKVAIAQQLNDKTPMVLVNAEMATIIQEFIEG